MSKFAASKFLDEESSLQKRMNDNPRIKDIIHQIDGPKPKRTIHDNEQADRKLKQSEQRSDHKHSNQESEMRQNEKKEQKEQKQEAKGKEKDNWKIKNIAYKFCPDITNEQEKEYERMTEILSYFLGQNGSYLEGTSNRNSVYMDWEIRELSKNYEDTNLGDFIFKLPNPDSMPENMASKEDPPKYSFPDAFENFDEMFNTEMNTDKSMEQCEKRAFLLAFYLLEEKDAHNQPKLAEVADSVKSFLQVYGYFEQIGPLSYIEYLGLQKSQEFKQREYQLEPVIADMRQPIEEAYRRDGIKIEDFEKLFFSYKEQVYSYMSRKLEEPIVHKNKTPYIIDSPFHIVLFDKTPSLSRLLATFPRLLILLRKEAYKKIKQNLESVKKKLYGGNYLKKVSSGGQLKWVRRYKRPRDVLTLLRNALVFRLSRRGGLFIRSFLSEDEHYIFLVVKASEQHLEKNAQKNKYNMEVELGATDIFSFEPVDRFNRPLRINSYIRDPAFIRKYNLQVVKGDRDESSGELSVESESIPLYNKAQKMNEDELRAKIILDQEELDDCYRWVSKLTGVKFIKHSETLNNSHNIDEIDEEVWPVYYVYSKMLSQSIQRLRQEMEGAKKSSQPKAIALKSNIGLILRLSFLKALYVGNELYRKQRKTLFRGIQNLGKDTQILKTLWKRIGEEQPRGFWPYFSSAKLECMWRKFQINEEKTRSKFTPAARLTITNDIVREYVNVSKSITERILIDYFPIHDPYILKNIYLRPYLNVISRLVQDKDNVAQEPASSTELLSTSIADVQESLVAFECEYTKEDFMKSSLRDKLRFKWRAMTEFSVQSVCFYCGEKIAFFFEFRRYLAKSALPFTLVAFIIQIIFWVELTQIGYDGSSRLTKLNNVLMFLLILVNVVWVDRTIYNWIEHEKKLARSFGTAGGNASNKGEKRILFTGEVRRNMENDEMNDEQVGWAEDFTKSAISLLISLIFVVCMGATILIIFALKTEMYQRGYSQTTVTVLPSILIALSVQAFNFAYQIIVKLLVDFENKKTVSEYESSLSSKSFVVTFVVSFYALFIYGFFSGYFEGSDVCTIKTKVGSEVFDCYYYMSGQITTSAVVDLAITIVMAFVPLLMFRVKEYLKNKKRSRDVTFNTNYFESIDRFYEEQDGMQSYMYTDEIDQTWQGYTQVVVAFSTLIMFGPIVPFLYSMIFINGIVSLHAKKYEIIYLSKRGLPIRTSSIGSWITMLKVVSVIGVFTNVAVVVYARELFPNRKSLAYFTIVFIILIIKYAVSLAFSAKEDLVGKRSTFKTSELIHERGLANFNTKTESIYTDIQNLYYDEDRLGRKFPTLKAANVRFR